jgi:hypothetical protein
MDPTPHAFITLLRAQFEGNHYNAVPVLSLGLKPGYCRACNAAHQHPAHVVVTTALSEDGTEPAGYLNCWSIECCREGLDEYIREQHQLDSFDGCTIEVPA